MAIPQPAKIDETLADANLQLAIYTATGRLMAKRKTSISGEAGADYQELRQHAHDLKRHTIENLDHYVEQVERNVVANGGKVVFCKDSNEVADFVLGLAKDRGAHLLVKSKSMTT